MHYFRQRKYFVYILTNKRKNVLYVGVTNNLGRRLVEHQNGLQPFSFTSRYNLFYLLYWEEFGGILDAIAREKQIKSWGRSKKEALINADNPQWEFLNHLVQEKSRE